MKKLEISSPPTIKEVLQDLAFLEYSTQTRNLTYRIQFQHVLLEIYENYKVYGSVETTFIRSFHDLTTNIIEYLLYIAVRQVAGPISEEKSAKQKLRKAAQKLGIISGDLSERVARIFGKRDKLHPTKQDELDVSSFNEEDLVECLRVTQEVLTEMRDYFEEGEIESPPEETSRICPYCGFPNPKDLHLCMSCDEPLFF